MTLFEKSRGISAVIGLDGRDDIQHGLKQQYSSLLHTGVRSHLSGSSAIQPLAASEESCHPRYYDYDYDDDVDDDHDYDNDDDDDDDDYRNDSVKCQQGRLTVQSVFT